MSLTQLVSGTVPTSKGGDRKKAYYVQLTADQAIVVDKDLDLASVSSDVMKGQLILRAAYLFNSLPTDVQASALKAFDMSTVPTIAKR